MKCSLLIFLIFATGITGYSQHGETTWAAQPKPYPPVTLRSVNFVSDSTGFAVSADGFSGMIMKTSDGGSTWIKFTGNPGAPLPGAYSVQFTDPYHGCVVGLVPTTAFPNGGSFTVTNDGGNTWTISKKEKIDYLLSVNFPDPFIGYAAGNYGSMIKTTNGGQSWTTLTNVTSSKLTSVFFTDTLIGYITSDANKIFKTITGGASWSIISIPTLSQKMNSVHFTDANTGYIAGNNGTIFKTIDAGINWTHLVIDSITDNLYSIWFTSSNHGYICGQNGLMLETHDAGATWSWSRPGGSDALYSVHFPTPETGYAVGANGRILKANVTWGTSSGGDFPEMHTLNIYPNPAQEQAFIQLPPDAGRENSFNLTITDVSGKQVEEQVPADGNGVITLGLGQFRKGLYVVKLEHGQNHYVGKLRIH